MKARAILFSGPMVRALLDGRKTQTRRVVKPQPAGMYRRDYEIRSNPSPFFVVDGREVHCPYGQPGDLLWVRETSSVRHARETCAACDNSDIAGLQARHYCRAVSYRADKDIDLPWTPGIHMPRWASRLTLRITDVRVQRLWDISEKDAWAEGVTLVEPAPSYLPYRAAYARLWTDINGAGSWDWNPLVWALTFEVIKQNVDQVLAAKAAA